MNKDDNQRQAADKKNTDEMSEAEIDNNLKGTFPASDPPSWTLGTNHRAATKQEEEKENRQKD